MIHQLAQLTQDGAKEYPVSSICMEQFPIELIEIIVFSAAVQLFRAISIVNVQHIAEVHAIATLSAVSSLWWRTFTYRKYNKRLLRRYFKQVCRPYKCTPQIVTSTHVEGVRPNVVSIAEWNMKLYVACDSSSEIKVFNSGHPFSHIEDITVQVLNDELGMPDDMAVCTDKSRLYITDIEVCAVWRVNLLHTKQVEKFITATLKTTGISVSSSRPLITLSDGELLRFSDDGNQLNRIKLPDCMMALHAWETTRNTYIVSYSTRMWDDKQHGDDSVAEVDVTGRVIRSFNNQHKNYCSVLFCYPYSLVLENDHVIVADNLNRRIILLQAGLRLKRVLIDSLHGPPRRMCLSPERYLFISYEHSPRIDVFSI